MMNWRDWEGSSHGVTEVLLRHLPGGTEGNHKKLQPGQFVSHQDSNQEFPINESSNVYYHYNIWLSCKLLKMPQIVNSKCNEKELHIIYANSTL
jgi:hypothetical protein